MPIVAIFWALIDGEVISMMQFFATAVILIGVFLVNKRKQTN
jgi:drug/metabolite transporter (DMT)-like permease